MIVIHFVLFLTNFKILWNLFLLIWINLSAADGDFWRLLNPGEYKVVVWAKGYFPSMRRCRVGMEPRPTICDFTLTEIPAQRLKEIQAKGGRVPQDHQLRVRALRLRKLRASTKAINRRREKQQLQTRRASWTGRGSLKNWWWLPDHKDVWVH